MCSDGVGDVLRRPCAARRIIVPFGLRHAARHARGHLGGGVADVDLAAGDVVARGRRARSTWSAR